MLMHANSPAFGVLLRGFLAFSPPDYRRMKSFDGHSRLTISSHTNVSATFSLFNCRMSPAAHVTSRNMMFNRKIDIAIICHII